MFDKLIISVLSVTILFTTIISIDTMVKYSSSASQVISDIILK